MTAVEAPDLPSATSSPTRAVGPAGGGATPQPDVLPHRCPHGCRWSGLRTCHCGGSAGCHRTFSGVTTFDAHRKAGQCVAPVTLGMTLSPRRAYDCWGTSEEDVDA